MEFTCVRFYLEPEKNEVLIAFLSDSDFQMFEEHDDGLSAYIPADSFSNEMLKNLLDKVPGSESMKHEVTSMPRRNWNEEWEKSFDPVYIKNKILIRAPFHPADDSIPVDIVIEPKMSFGTGHHPTTSMMLNLMTDEEFKNKYVLDIGCGSGILSIAAIKFGAEKVLAIDFDEWACSNAMENIEMNQCNHVTVIKGDMRDAGDALFDIILANINRNVLLADMHAYAVHLNNGGRLYISGFLSEDEELLDNLARQHGLSRLKNMSDHSWMCIVYQKENN